MKRQIGQTGIFVNPIGLGGMPLSIQGRPQNERQALEVVFASLHAGVDFIDTADVYCLDDSDIGHNERLIDKALKEAGRKKDVTVATKGGLIRPQGRWEVCASPEHLRSACERSLQSLDVAQITLYQLHAPDPKVPFTKSVEELANLQRQKKVKHVGLSNVSLEQLKQAQKVVRIESVQNLFNPFVKDDLMNGMIEYCGQQGITYIPYSPVGGGRHRGRLVQHPMLSQMATQHQCSVYQLALAWMLHLGEHLLPIPGASRMESAIDSPLAVRVQLTSAEVGQITDLR